MTEDSYLGDIREPLTLNRYSYCIGNPLFYSDPSGHLPQGIKNIWNWLTGANKLKPEEIIPSKPAQKSNKNKEQAGNGSSSSQKDKLEEQIEDATENGKSEDCEDSVSEAIRNIDGYLAGNVSEKDARKYIEELAKTGALYDGQYITSVKSYKSDFENRDYDQFDTQIIGWVAYYNYKKPDYSINPEWVKAMIYEESRYSYVYNNSPNANASRDIMQTLDPRNPTIFGYVSVDIANTMVAGAAYDGDEPEEWVTVATIRKWNDKGPILQENVGGDIIPVAQTLFNIKDDKYYYNYSNATPFMSLGIGIHTLEKKYESLNSSTEHSIPDDILEIYNVGNEKYVEKVNYLLDLDVYPGWEYEYDKKFKK